MKAEALSYFHMPYLTQIGLLIFFSFFMCLLYLVFHKKRLPYYEHLAQLPISED